MIKLIALIKKKPGLTREQFIDYYENHHAPQGAKLFGIAGEYRRNYVRPPPYYAGGDPGFDVMTEVVFRDKEAFDLFTARRNDPRLLALNRDDYQKYRDEDLRAFFVDVYESKL